MDGVVFFYVYGYLTVTSGFTLYCGLVVGLGFCYLTFNSRCCMSLFVNTYYVGLNLVIVYCCTLIYMCCFDELLC